MAETVQKSCRATKDCRRRFRLAENAAKANKHCDPVYPEHVAGANDGSCFSDTDTYKEIIAMERENTILCAKLDKLIEEGDGFDV